jgi:mannose-1-phosphate guanylyltransferase
MPETRTTEPRRITPVILCGGSGTRLWPRSRRGKPKPFLPLIGPETLFEQTLGRCDDRRYFEPPVIVTGAPYLEHARCDLAARRAARIIVEPQSKNTAAAVALAAMRVPADAVLLVCPSDHHIGNSSAFVEAARSAAALAEQGWLVCFGVEARTPETRFGYLLRGDPLEPHGHRVRQFVEKPDLSRAAAYVASGDCAWNGGIFALRAGDYIAELQRFRPKLAAAVEAAVDQGKEEDEVFHPAPEPFGTIEAESIDYAVMENTGRAAMIEAPLAWSDIGNWFALHGARARDEFGNSVRGPVEVLECRNVMVDSDGPRVSLIGMEDVIVVVDGDDVMIMSRDSANDVPKLLRANAR